MVYCKESWEMAEDLSALCNLLSHQIKQGELERALTEFVCTLERKYEKQQTFIRSLECNNHVGLKEDELGNAFIPEDLPLAAAEVNYYYPFFFLFFLGGGRPTLRAGHPS